MDNADKDTYGSTPTLPTFEAKKSLKNTTSSNVRKSYGETPTLPNFVNTKNIKNTSNSNVGKNSHISANIKSFDEVKSSYKVGNQNTAKVSSELNEWIQSNTKKTTKINAFGKEKPLEFTASKSESSSKNLYDTFIEEHTSK